jgi:hypothetical protein
MHALICCAYRISHGHLRTCELAMHNPPPPPPCADHAAGGDLAEPAPPALPLLPGCVQGLLRVLGPCSGGGRGARQAPHGRRRAVGVGVGRRRRLSVVAHRPARRPQRARHRVAGGDTREPVVVMAPCALRGGSCAVQCCVWCVWCVVCVVCGVCGVCGVVWGALLSRRAVYSVSVVRVWLLCDVARCTALHCAVLRCTALRCASLPFPSLRFSSLPSPSRPFPSHSHLLHAFPRATHCHVGVVVCVARPSVGRINRPAPPRPAPPPPTPPPPARARMAHRRGTWPR